MCGTTYQKNKKIITIEFHLGEAKLDSIVKASERFTNYLQLMPNLSNEKIKQYMQDLNHFINNKFYVVVSVYAINGQIQESESEIKYFSKNKTPSEIENWCMTNLNQFTI